MTTLPARAALVALAAFSHVAGIGGGLVRLGWALPLPNAAASHGALMISGFLGTVISLERAVALGHPLAFAAPLAAGMGSVLLLYGIDSRLWLAAPVLLLAVSVAIVRRQRALHTVLLAVAAAAWLVGNALHVMRAAANTTAGWWFAFLVLTIVAERLELTRLAPPRPLSRPTFFALAGLLVTGAVTASPPVWGAALAGFAFWLIAFDIARRTARTQGLARYAAIALLIGYAWLAVGGLAWAAMPYLDYPLRDTALHALGIGFVFSMIFAHAPIVLPAIVRITVRHTPLLYVPLGLLHLSVALRLIPDARAWSGVLSAAALLAFIATLACAARGRSGSATR